MCNKTCVTQNLIKGQGQMHDLNLSSMRKLKRTRDYVSLVRKK